MKVDIMKIEHKTKKELAYSILKSLILNKKWNPGERKTFSEISELLDVSRTPVSEACKMLEYDEWVEIKPQVGVEPIMPSIEKIAEIMKIRAVLEGLAGMEAIPHLGKKDFEILEQKVTEMIETESNNDYLKFSNVNRSFHKYIYKATKMVRLAKILDHYWDSMNFFHFSENLPNLLKHSNIHHRNILSALKSKDANAARSSLEGDSLDFAEILIDYLKK